MENLNIVILGAGNVAHHLAHQLKQAGHDIIQVYSYTETAAEELADRVNSIYTNDLNELAMDGDVYLMALKDDAVAEIASGIRLRDKIIAHTSATVPMNTLSGSSDHYGVFYPLQTLTKDHEVDFKSVPLCIEASDDFTKEQLEALAKTITDSVHYIDSEKRKILHVGAVLVNNFTNKLYQAAEEILKDEKLNFNLLKPLILETVRKIETVSPKEAQTGPATRSDLKTVQEHLQILDKYPIYKEIYLVMTESILEAAKEDQL